MKQKRGIGKVVTGFEQLSDDQQVQICPAGLNLEISLSTYATENFLRARFGKLRNLHFQNSFLNLLVPPSILVLLPLLPLLLLLPAFPLLPLLPLLPPSELSISPNRKYAVRTVPRMVKAYGAA